MPGDETTIWPAFFAPARTPQPLLERLGAEVHAAVHAAVHSASYRERLLALDMQPATSMRGELAGYLRTELAKWQQVVKSAGIVVE